MFIHRLPIFIGINVWLFVSGFIQSLQLANDSHNISISDTLQGIL